MTTTTTLLLMMTTLLTTITTTTMTKSNWQKKNQEGVDPKLGYNKMLAIFCCEKICSKFRTVMISKSRYFILRGNFFSSILKFFFTSYWNANLASDVAFQ